MSKRKAPAGSPNQGITDLLTGKGGGGSRAAPRLGRSNRVSPRRAGELRAEREPGHPQVQRVQVTPPPPPLPGSRAGSAGPRPGWPLTRAVPQEGSLRYRPVPQRDTERGRSQEAGRCPCPACRRHTRRQPGGRCRGGAAVPGRRGAVQGRPGPCQLLVPAASSGQGVGAACGCCGGLTESPGASSCLCA